MLNASAAFSPPAPPRGVHQGSVLSPLYFLPCTPRPLSTLMSSQSPNHHLYADDTQLFFSFYPPDLHSSISHLQTALQKISSWMTTNNSQILQNWISSHRTQTATNQDTKLHSHHNPLCSQSRLHLWWTPVFLWPNNCTFQVLQLSHSSTLLYQPIHQHENSQHHCHLYCSLLSAWLLQLTTLQSPQLTTIQPSTLPELSCSCSC